MKFVYSLLLCVAAISSLHSQNVTFTDPAFEARLLSSSPTNTVAKNLQGQYFAIDSNADGVIQVSEALEVSALTVQTSYYYQIQSFEGIEAFTNVTFLDFSGNYLVEYLELTNFPYLAYVDVAPMNMLRKMVITDNPQLTEIDFTCVDCTIFLDALDTLICARNNLTSLDVASTGFSAGAPPIDYLDFSDNHISEYDFESCGVEYLNVSGNDFTRLDIDIYNLETLTIDDNPLTYLRLYHTGLDTVIIHDFPELDSLQVIGYLGYPDNRAKHMELSNLPSLEYLDCSLNYFEQLTISDLPLLNEFTIDGMDMALTLHNLPAMTALDTDKLEDINSLTVSELDNIAEINIDFIYHTQFSNLQISDMESLSVLKLGLDITGFTINNAPELDSVYFINGYGYNTFGHNLTFADLPQLKYLNVNAETPDSTVHLSNLPLLNCLIVTNGNISTLNLHDLPALSDVSLRCYRMHDLNLQNLQGLSKLEIETARLKDLVLTDLPVKVFKYTLNLDLTGRTLIFGNLPQIDTIHLINSDISELNFSNLPHLRDVKVKGNRLLNSFILNNLPMLNSLDIYGVWLESLVITGFPNLNSVKLTGINVGSVGFYMLSDFELSDLPNLEYLSIRDNVFFWETRLNIVDFPNLTTMWLKQSEERITLANLPRLTNFYLKDRMISDSLDFSGCPSLEHLDIDWFGNLGFLNLKNGNNTISSINTTRPVTHICVDDQSEANLVKTLDPDLLNAVYTTNCESNLCPVNRIRGTVLYDTGNGCIGSGRPCDNTQVTIEGEHSCTLLTDSAGSFEYVTQDLNSEFIITPHFDKEFYEAAPQSATVSFNTYGNVSDMLFCVSSGEMHNDLEVILSSGERTRPGFDFTCNVDYTNNGTMPGEGVVNLHFNDAVMDVVTVDPPYDHYFNGILSWDFSDLVPFENRAVTVKFNLNTPEEIPPLTGGEHLDFKAEVIPAAADEYLDDNTCVLYQTVVNSYDPNDKTCLEGDAINIEWAGDYVHYLIRFENKGSVEAEYVRVRDIIDTLKFDISSFVILCTSHDCETRITEGNVIDFIFNNINLPNNTGENDGFISFKIRTLSNLQLNDIFLNRALIYFDYNAPVYTNECETIILLNVNTERNNVPESDVKVFPNPVDEIIKISSGRPIQQIDVIDLNGRLIESFSGTETIKADNLKSGIYFLRVMQKTGVTVIKIVKV